MKEIKLRIGEGIKGHVITGEVLQEAQAMKVREVTLDELFRQKVVDAAKAHIGRPTTPTNPGEPGDPGSFFNTSLVAHGLIK